MNMKKATGLGRRTASGLFSIGAALALCFGLSVSAQAQTCVVSNWDATPGLSNTNAGTQGSANRRYGGPCGLRVPFGGGQAFVENTNQQGTTTSLDEPVYKVRFYAFLDNLTGTDVPIFEGYNALGDAVFTVFYTDNGDLEFDANGDTVINETVNVGNGWHSIEIVYSATDNTFTISVDGTDINVPGLTLTENVAAVRMGDIDGVGGGTADFDDFDSRRVDRPGRLPVGDADGNGEIDIFDALPLRDELEETAFAPGQPDCDENGEVDIFDAPCLRDLIN